jgi:hypothetical protein
MHNEMHFEFLLDEITLNQACQTQTTSRAAKGTKNAKGAAKVSK